MPEHATTVMILTGTNPATSTHWVNVNNNIPFGNVSISADDISERCGTASGLGHQSASRPGGPVSAAHGRDPSASGLSGSRQKIMIQPHRPEG